MKNFKEFYDVDTDIDLVHSDTMKEGLFNKTLATGALAAATMFGHPSEAESASKKYDTQNKHKQIKTQKHKKSTIKPIKQYTHKGPIKMERATDSWLPQITEEIKKLEYPTWIQKGHMKNGLHMPYLDPNKRDWIIGYGHKLTAIEKAKYKKGASNSVIDALLKQDINMKVGSARRMIPSFDKLSSARKMAIVNALFRGEIESHHQAVMLINAGRFSDAATEYLDRKDYKNAVEKGINAGIAERMRKNATRLSKG